MSMLDSQLRRSRRECEERRRYLAELRLLGERLRVDARRLLGEIEESGGGASPLRERQRKLAGSIGEIERQITAASDALAAAEEDLRRHEFAWRQRAGNARSSMRPSRPRAAAAPTRRPSRPA